MQLSEQPAEASLSPPDPVCRRESLPAGPDQAALGDFLQGARIRTSDGRILGWVGDGGFPYDEATVLLARLGVATGWPETARLSSVIAGQVARQGWLGRDGLGYVFDSALVLGLPGEHGPLRDRVLVALRAGRALMGQDNRDRWSQRFGPHLIKAAAEAGEPRVVEHLVEATYRGGRFYVAPGSSETYLHSHCYAVEGLVALGGYEAVVREALDWLVERQHADGSWPAWVGRADARRPSDVVAQAVRLFRGVDVERYQRAIELGLGRLRAMQSPSGGLRYTPGSEHVNVWASIFAADALSRRAGERHRFV